MSADTHAFGTIRLAIVATRDPSCPTWWFGLLAFDGHGHRQLRELPAPLDVELAIATLFDGPPRQLALPLGAGSEPPSSAGLSWRSWELPTIPHRLRTVPPDRLLDALAAELTATCAHLPDVGSRDGRG